MPKLRSTGTRERTSSNFDPVYALSDDHRRSRVALNIGGIDSDSKEAIAFAILAYESFPQ